MKKQIRRSQTVDGISVDVFGPLDESAVARVVEGINADLPDPDELEQREERERIWRELLGKCVDVPLGDEMAELAFNAAHFAETTPSGADEKFSEMQRSRLASRLGELLADSLAQLDPLAFENFAKILRAVALHQAQPDARFNFGPKALWLASELKFTGEKLTQNAFLERLGIDASDRDKTAFYRRKLKDLGIRFRAKRGVKKGTETPKK
jgi:hypothetical protein